MHAIPSGPDSYIGLPRSRGIAYVPQESWILSDTIKVPLMIYTTCPVQLLTSNVERPTFSSATPTMKNDIGKVLGTCCVELLEIVMDSCQSSNNAG